MADTRSMSKMQPSAGAASGMTGLVLAGHQMTMLDRRPEMSV
jgi:hypothetical protein